MDPLSIAASVTALATLCGRVVVLCNNIAGKQKAIRRTLIALRTEIVAYQASLHHIQDLLLDQTGSLAEYLSSNGTWKDSFDTALSACGITVSILISELEKAIEGSTGSSYKYFLKEEDIKELIGELRGQQGAVQLLVQTLQMKSTAHILQILTEKRDVLQSIKKQTDTLSGHWGFRENSDNSDTFSIFSVDLNNRTFAFDEEISKLGPYRRALKAQTQHLGQQQPLQGSVGNLIDDDLLDLGIEPLTPGPWTAELHKEFSNKDSNGHVSINEIPSSHGDLRHSTSSQNEVLARSATGSLRQESINIPDDHAMENSPEREDFAEIGLHDNVQDGEERKNLISYEIDGNIYDTDSHDSQRYEGADVESDNPYRLHSVEHDSAIYFDQEIGTNVEVNEDTITSTKAASSEHAVSIMGDSSFRSGSPAVTTVPESRLVASSTRLAQHKSGAAFPSTSWESSRHFRLSQSMSSRHLNTVEGEIPKENLEPRKILQDKSTKRRSEQQQERKPEPTVAELADGFAQITIPEQLTLEPDQSLGSQNTVQGLQDEIGNPESLWKLPSLSWRLEARDWAHFCSQFGDIPLKKMKIKAPFHHLALMGDVNKILGMPKTSIESTWLGRTPLGFAAMNENAIEGLRALLARGAKAKTSSYNNPLTPLDWAIVCGNHQAVKLLTSKISSSYITQISIMINENKHNNVGWTPLSLAAFLGHLQVVDVLLKEKFIIKTEYPARPSSRLSTCNYLLPPLHAAVASLPYQFIFSHTYCEFPTYGGVYEHNAPCRNLLDINHINSLRTKSASLWLPQESTDADAKRTIAMVDLLSKSKLESVALHLEDPRGYTALHVACCGTSTSVVERLIELGSRLIPDTKPIPSKFLRRRPPHLAYDLGSVDSPLHLAAFWNRVEIVKLLIKKGVDPNVSGYRGRTPLHYAAAMSNIDTIKVLVQEKAKIDCLDKSNQDTPLSLALEWGSWKAAILLMKSKSKLSWTIYQYSHRNPLLPTSHEWAKETILHKALGFRPTAVRLLLEHGALPNAGNLQLETPLHTLCQLQKDNREKLNLLLQHGANVNARDRNNNTPLHYAVSACSKETYPVLVVRILLKAKANPLLENDAGDTPLSLILRIVEKQEEGYLNTSDQEVYEQNKKILKYVEIASGKEVSNRMTAREQAKVAMAARRSQYKAPAPIDEPLKLSGPIRDHAPESKGREQPLARFHDSDAERGGAPIARNDEE
ncbi:ankyrin repeat-containing domain protein [Tricladium varicosporioides]|nr:ankyrin repeat-containing domain protein [Hymenoscyphus varicosporioides]